MTDPIAYLRGRAGKSSFIQAAEHRIGKSRGAWKRRVVRDQGGVSRVNGGCACIGWGARRESAGTCLRFG